MKTLKYLSTTAFVVSLAMFASCSSDNDIETNNENNTNNGNTNSEKLVFSASIVPNEVTRATLNEVDKTLYWEANDEIAVCSDKASTFTKFTIDNKYADKTIAYFVSDMPGLQAPNDYYYAFYPYSSVQSVTTYSNNTTYGHFISTMKSEQEVTEGYPYDRSCVTMIARATPSEKSFAFKNVPALLKVTINNNDNGKVKYIKIFSNNDKKYMAGTFDAYLKLTSEGSFDITNITNGLNFVQLEIPENGSGTYYIATLKNTLDKGFTLLLESEFNTETGSQYIYQRRYTSSIQFEPNCIYDMGTYDVSSLTFLDNVVDLGLPSATIWTTKNLEDGDNGKAKFVDDFYSYGGYYSWGETRTKDTNKYNQNNYPLYNKKDAYNTSNVLKTDYDVAYQMNSVYRIPSYTQFTELLNAVLNAGFTQTNTLSGNGNRGIKFTNSKGRYIWFPAGGCNYANITGSSSVHDAGTMAQYWSRTVHHSNSEPNAETYAKCFDINSSGEYAHGVLSGTGKGYDRRFAGKSIRPVLYK